MDCCQQESDLLSEQKVAKRLYHLLSEHCGLHEYLSPKDVTPEMSKLIRSIVSKKKKRFQEQGYDLDLSCTKYFLFLSKKKTLDISERIIAMGLPSVGAESLYRNSMDDVRKFFAQKHKGHYKVINLYVCTPFF